jgi:hypothetical protein
MKASTIINRAVANDVQRARDAFRTIREHREIRRGDLLCNAVERDARSVTVCRVDPNFGGLGQAFAICTNGANTFFIPVSWVGHAVTHYRVVRKLSIGERIVERIS